LVKTRISNNISIDLTDIEDEEDEEEDEECVHYIIMVIISQSTKNNSTKNILVNVLK